MITLDRSAPVWAHDLARQVEALFRRRQPPRALPEYATADLPDPAKLRACLIYVTDGTANKRLAVSDGAAWRFPDGNIVS